MAYFAIPILLILTFFAGIYLLFFGSMIAALAWRYWPVTLAGALSVAALAAWLILYAG